MRPNARAKAGFYPTPVHLVETIAAAFKPNSFASVLDPCAGEAVALEIIKRRVGGQATAIELEAGRCAEAAKRVDVALCGDAMQFVATHFSMLWLNPPYDQGPNGERLERVFLRKKMHSLCPRGVLVLIIPEYVLEECRDVLEQNFYDHRLYRFPEPDYQRYQQIVVIAKKRNLEVLNEKMTVRIQALAEIQAIRIPSSQGVCEPIAVDPVVVHNQVLAGELWKAFYSKTAIQNSDFTPAGPLKAGHLALLVSAGSLNGEVVEDEAARLLVKGVCERSNVEMVEDTKKIVKQIFNSKITTLDLATGDLCTVGAESAVDKSEPQFKQEMSMTQFMARFGQQLMQKAGRRFPPLVQSNRIRLPKLKRRPWAGQLPALAALEAGFKTQKRMILVGEMGTGKTLLGIIAAAMQKHKRTLVVCPPHLVDKWKREVEETINSPAYILNSIADVEAARHLHGVFVLSRERAKLGSAWRPAFNVQFRSHALKCADCGSLIRKPDDSLCQKKDLEKTRQKCRQCNAPLWQVDGSRFRRVALGDYILRQTDKGFFGLFINDEAHESRGGQSAQGIMAGSLVEHSSQALALTGTLFGGYASTLFSLLWRFSSKVRELYKLDEEKRFVADFGLVQTTVELEGADGKVSRRKATTEQVRERPGMSPSILPLILPNTVFLRLSELGVALPVFSEHVMKVEMDADQAEVYHDMQEDLLGHMRNSPTSELQSKAMHALLWQADSPFRLEKIEYGRTTPNGVETILAHQSKVLPQTRIYPKEEALIEIAGEERNNHKKTLVFVQGTGKRDVIERLRLTLTAAGLRVAALRAETIEPKKRESHIEKIQNDIDVLICHPKVVQTGLDLLAFATIVFMQPELSTYVMRQAARRSYRGNQTEAMIKVYHLVYSDTQQVPAVNLVANKAKSSLALEGELNDTGLTNLADDNIMLTMAKNLMRGNEVIEEGLEVLNYKRKGLTLSWPQPTEIETTIQLFDPATTEAA